MRRDEAYLLDILLAARRARKYVENMRWEEFETNEIVQDAVVFPLEIMGEAAGRISEEFRINLKMIWDTLKNDLPDLISMLEPLIPEE
jgi:uncharacterized protein with HEPN domain